MHLPMLEILHHLLKNRMVSGNSTLNTGLKIPREEFPVSQRTAFLSGEQGALPSGACSKLGQTAAATEDSPWALEG